jgi:hypothetical protein
MLSRDEARTHGRSVERARDAIREEVGAIDVDAALPQVGLHFSVL